MKDLVHHFLLRLEKRIDILKGISERYRSSMYICIYRSNHAHQDIKRIYVFPIWSSLIDPRCIYNSIGVLGSACFGSAPASADRTGQGVVWNPAAASRISASAKAMISVDFSLTAPIPQTEQSNWFDQIPFRLEKRWNSEFPTHALYDMIEAMWRFQNFTC